MLALPEFSLRVAFFFQPRDLDFFRDGLLRAVVSAASLIHIAPDCGGRTTVDLRDPSDREPYCPRRDADWGLAVFFSPLFPPLSRIVFHAR